MTELAVLVQPTAMLVTTEHGVHEITRCYFQPRRDNDRRPVEPPVSDFTMGHDIKRLGGMCLERAHYSTDRGLLMEFSGGYFVSVPGSHCQATWRA